MILETARHSIAVSLVTQSINDPEPDDQRDATCVLELAYFKNFDILETETRVFRFESDETDSYAIALDQKNAEATHAKLVGVTLHSRIGANRAALQVVDQVDPTLTGTLYNIPLEAGELLIFRDGLLHKYNADGTPALATPTP